MQKNILKLLVLFVSILVLPNVVNAGVQCTYDNLTGYMADWNTGVKFTISQGANNTIYYTNSLGMSKTLKVIDYQNLCSLYPEDVKKNDNLAQTYMASPDNYFISIGSRLTDSSDHYYIVPTKELYDALGGSTCPTFKLTYIKSLTCKKIDGIHNKCGMLQSEYQLNSDGKTIDGCGKNSSKNKAGLYTLFELFEESKYPSDRSNVPGTYKPVNTASRTTLNVKISNRDMSDYAGYVNPVTGEKISMSESVLYRLKKHIVHAYYDKSDSSLYFDLDNGQSSALSLIDGKPISVDADSQEGYRILAYNSSSLLNSLQNGLTTIFLEFSTARDAGNTGMYEIYVMNSSDASAWYQDNEYYNDSEADKQAKEDVEGATDRDDLEDESKIIDYEELIFCEQEGVLKTLNILGWLLYFLKIAVPGVLIVMCVIDFATAVTKSDEKALTTAMTTSTRRVIAAVAIFLVPSITYVIINLIGNSVSDDDSFKACNECLLKPSKCNVSTINYKEPENSSSGKKSKYQECIDKQCVNVPDGEQRENCKKQCKANNPE